MTQQQLEDANKLSKEIKNMSQLVSALDLTINNVCDTRKPLGALKSILRFVNARIGTTNDREAKIRLLKGLSDCNPIDIPVDLETIEN